MKKNFPEKKIEILSQGLENLVEYTKSLWQFLPIAVCNVSPQGFILDVNQVFENFSLWSISEIAGKSIEIIFSQKETAEIIKQTLEKRHLINREAELLTKKGEKIDVAIYSHTREDKEGNIVGFFLSFIDIRESKKFREELKRQVNERTKELQEKIKELEKINRLTVDRELKMLEFKREIKELKARLEGKPR